MDGWLDGRMSMSGWVGQVDARMGGKRHIESEFKGESYKE